METNANSHIHSFIVYKRMKTILKASFVANIILSLALFCVYINNRSGGFRWTDVIPPPNTTNGEAQVSKESYGIKELCITCDLSANDTRNTLYDYITTARYTNLCCLENDPDKQDIILELAATGHTPYMYDGASSQKLKWWTDRDYAAHLYAHRLRNKDKFVLTSKRHSTSFVRNLTLPSDDWRTLTVPDTAGAGIYFVYSMFTFDFLDKSNMEHSQTIRHVITRYNNSLHPENEETLLRSTQGDDMSTRQTTFLSGIVRLFRSDSIGVKAFSMSVRDYTTEKYIDMSSPYYNFFGMFKLE